MNYYRTAGLIEGYIPEAALIDGYTMFFYVEGRLMMRFDVSNSAVASRDCGIDQSDIFNWLWEEGNELILRNSFNYGVHILATSYDVRNGQVTTPFNNLIKD